MKIRLSDYVADFLVDHGISDCFMVVGGGAMHLNDALGHRDGLKCTFTHHEQGAAIAAEAYARINNKMAALSVTTGPGGTNAITGVLGGWLDSVPMFVISGQVRYDTTARYMEQFTNGLPMRAVGDQEFDITKSVSAMCKYAVMIEDPYEIRYCLEKAYHLAMTGRRGPVWLDIPLNYQGMYIETDELKGYDPLGDEAESGANASAASKEADKSGASAASDKSGVTAASDKSGAAAASDMSDKSDEAALYEEIIGKIKNSKRPVLYGGNGIRLSEGYPEFRKLVELLGIPVVTCWDSIDLIPDENPLYVGRGGIMGNRPGNFAVQNSDLILAIGNRLSIRQVGYTWDKWATKAFVIDVDVDPAELMKKTIHVELPVCMDAKVFMSGMIECIEKDASLGGTPLFDDKDWLTHCADWKKDYPVTLPKHWEENGSTANVYAFIKYLSESLPENRLTVVSNGSACVVGSHNYVIKEGTRFIINSGVASMGYGLPAAIGACIADGRQETICIEGDGSIMMNLQELQTVLTNKLPIKLFLINNNGYHSIRQTQNNVFAGHSKVGIGPESNDLEFPDFGKLSEAFGYKYFSAHSNEEMKKVVDKVLSMEGPVFAEIFVSTDQVFEPKSGTKRLEDGTLVSPPLEDLAPYLPREEVEKNMLD